MAAKHFPGNAHGRIVIMAMFVSRYFFSVFPFYFKYIAFVIHALSLLKVHK